MVTLLPMTKNILRRCRRAKINKKVRLTHMVRVPTTYEMDGLFTEEDIKNKDVVVFQCRSCRKWTPHKLTAHDVWFDYVPCQHCGEVNYDMSSIKSLRTYNPFIDDKRKIK